MANQGQKPTKQKPQVVCNQCLYEQLSEDWRHRDRLSWQLPPVLIVVGGLLLIGIFAEEGISDEYIRKLLLVGALFFTLILTIFLTRNLYCQAVGTDLMDKIRNGGTPQEVEEAKRGAQRIPLRRTGYSFSNMLGDIFKPLASWFLFGLVILIAGLFIFLLTDKCLCCFALGSLSSLAVVFAILSCSYARDKVT